MIELVNAPLQNKKDGEVLIGKGDLFPILGTQYAMNEFGDLNAEDPALIDPTKRNPEKHLRWLEIDGKSLIGPKENNGQIDPYGHHTYQVFGLNRQGLVEERTVRRLLVQKGFLRVSDLLRMSVTQADPYGKELRDIAFKQLEELYELALPHQPYSAMVEDLVKHETASLEATYQKLFDTLT